MRQLNRMTICLIAGISILGGCGLIPGKYNAGDVANAFYNYQLDKGSLFPSELFADTQVAIQAESLVSRRDMAYGSYRSHNRIGTNRRIFMEGQGRKEIVTYIFDVTEENGRTRETLMLSRNSTTEPFLITAYVIEDIPRLQNPAPVGTSST